MPSAKRKRPVRAKKRCDAGTMEAVRDMASHCSTDRSVKDLFRLVLVVGHGLFEVTRIFVLKKIQEKMREKTRSEYFSLGQTHVTTICDADFCRDVFGEDTENIDTFNEMVLVNMEFLYKTLLRSHKHRWSHVVDDVEGIRITSTSTAVSTAVGGDDESDESSTVITDNAESQASSDDESDESVVFTDDDKSQASDDNPDKLPLFNPFDELILEFGL